MRLFGWFRREEKPLPQVYVAVSQGVRGQWRWFVRDEDDNLLAQGPVRGYLARELAYKAAEALLNNDFLVVRRFNGKHEDEPGVEE